MAKSEYIPYILFGILGVLIDEKYSYQVSGTGMRQSIDKKATKKYYQSNQGKELIAGIKQRLEFEVLMMSYVMNEDDGKLTNDEVRLFKQHIKPYAAPLSKQDIKQLENLLKRYHRPQDLVRYAVENHLDKETIERSFGLLEIWNQVTGRYGDIILSLRHQFAYHIDSIV